MTMSLRYRGWLWLCLAAALFWASLASDKVKASNIDGSWPVFKKQATVPKPDTARKKYRKKYRASKSHKGKRKISSRRKSKRRARAKFRRRTTRPRLRRKRRGKPAMTRMTGHNAEKNRKHKVITVKTFEYPDLMTDTAAEGEKIFKENCVACHGENALGTEHGPPLLHDYYRPGHHADLALYAAPLYGVEAHHWKFGDMPKIETVSKKDVHKLIIYIRTLQRANGIY